jgi:hypothetical protein
VPQTTVTIENPTAGELLPVGQPIIVAGVACGVGGAEPHLIDSVTIIADGGPA